MMKKLKVLFVILLFPLWSYGQTWVERSTDVLCLAPSATGLVKAVVEKDRKGIVELGLSSATTIALNYALEATITKDRPDGTGHHSFPSTHTAAAFDGATFLMRRYGWQWGVPAYAVSAYVAWGRVHAQRHDWWDVLGGAVLGAGSALIYTRPFAENIDVVVAPATFGKDGCGVYMALSF